MDSRTSQQNSSSAMSLLTTTTGFVDVYVIEASEQLPWLIPQNLVLAALSAEANTQEVEWRDFHLPVLSLVKTDQQNPVALVLEGYNQHRFALLTEKMPEAHRVRISSLHDSDHQPTNEALSFQIVTMEEKLYQVPDFDKISQTIAKKA